MLTVVVRKNSLLNIFAVLIYIISSTTVAGECSPTSKIFNPADCKEIVLKIVYSEIDAPIENANAVELLFTNHSKNFVVIPLCSRVGKVINNYQQTKNKDTIATFARIHLRWLDENGNEITTDFYDVSAPAIELAPNQNHSLLIPLAKNSIIGARKLEVQFDNRQVEEAVRSFSLFQYLPPESGRFFTKTITIKLPGL